MKLGIFAAAAISAALVSAASAAQENDKPKSRVIVEDGKEMTDQRLRRTQSRRRLHPDQRRWEGRRDWQLHPRPPQRR